MNRLLAILIFCAVPPLVALAALGRLTALALATLSRFGFQRLLAAVLVGWIIVPQLAGRGVFGILPRWLMELCNIAYVCAAVGLPCLVGYWIIRWYVGKQRADRNKWYGRGLHPLAKAESSGRIRPLFYERRK